MQFSYIIANFVSLNQYRMKYPVINLMQNIPPNFGVIEYALWNNPRRILFTNGNVTKYVYTASGQKLRTIHYTAAPNIKVSLGTVKELIASEIQSKDSTDYLLEIQV